MNKLQSFFYGIIAALGTVILQQIVLILFRVEIIDTSQLTPLLIFGALTEEIFKFIFIYKLAQTAQSNKNLIYSSLLVGLGFSLTELIFKLWENFQNIKINFFDYFGLVLIHLLTAGVIGLFLSLKKPLWIRIMSGILVAAILHLAYNAWKIY